MIPQFIKWKVTIIYALFVLVLLGGQFIFGKTADSENAGQRTDPAATVWQRLESRLRRSSLYRLRGRERMSRSGYPWIHG